MEADDRFEVHELIARYNWAIDTRQPEAFAATFVPDGRFVGPTGQVVAGSAELEQMIKDMEARSVSGQHWVTNIVIEGGPIDAELKAYMLRTAPTEAGPIVTVMGKYNDQLVKTTHGWRFVERRFSTW